MKLLLVYRKVFKVDIYLYIMENANKTEGKTSKVDSLKTNIYMNAQEIVDQCNITKFNQRNFRNEINLSMFLQDVVAEFKRQEELR